MGYNAKKEKLSDEYRALYLSEIFLGLYPIIKGYHRWKKEMLDRQ